MFHKPFTYQVLRCLGRGNSGKLGLFPSGLACFFGSSCYCSRTWLAAPPGAGMAVSRRNRVRSPARNRSHRTLPSGRKQVATGFWVRHGLLSSPSRLVGWHFGASDPQWAERVSVTACGMASPSMSRPQRPGIGSVLRGKRRSHRTLPADFHRLRSVRS
jgi:hypothetical protein